MNSQKITLSSIITFELSGSRLDQALAKLFPDYSRSQLQNWIRAGHVFVDDKPQTTIRSKVLAGQAISIMATLQPTERWVAQDIPLEVCYEDNALIVINKPAGLVVHPGAGVPDHTLINALLHYDANLATIPRAGIIHRLDKETSGLLVIARTLPAHHTLVKQMKQRAIEREYEAIVKGVLISGATINAPIGRHPVQRTRMTVIASGREAITHYRIIKRYRAHTHIRIRLETGRTHQIRVHMNHIHHPLVGDPSYGQQIGIPNQVSAPLKKSLQQFKRQALHAATLRLQHPTTQRMLEWHAPLPADMDNLIKKLQADITIC